MINNIENLKPISVIRGISSVFKEYVNRESHALVFKLNGSSKYTFADKAILHRENQLLFIPQGTTYTVERQDEEPTDYLLINFLGNISHATPELFPLKNAADIPFLCSRISKLRGFSSLADSFRCQSLIYEILALIAENNHDAYCTIDTYHLIEPAVKYLHENMFNSQLKIGCLHEKATVSDTYFRKIFLSRFGVSPKKYVINKRLSHAKALLENGEFSSISEVALLCGFEDPLYFSKVYKTKYGRAPSSV